MPNQDPEQFARDIIDKHLIAYGWVIQDKDKINLNANGGVVVRYYLTQDGKETDYVMFVDKKPVGVIEAKREEEGVCLTTSGLCFMKYTNSKEAEENYHRLLPSLVCKAGLPLFVNLLLG